MIGTKLLHYEITEKLGEGGMGVVYKARDTHLDRFVAIKVLPPEMVAHAGRKARFAQEAKAASALNHPNIITIHDITSDTGRDFIVMEYVAGKTLDQLIPRKGMRLGEALKIAVQIADALTRAHGAGIIHRDLKPANIMVDEHGQVRVLDFGLAKLAERESSDDETTATVGVKTEEGAIVGTAAYMSPEQAEGKPVDARSDIFSFGSLLYEMVTGHRAFTGDSGMSTLAAIIKEEPAPLASDVPHDLNKLIARCLRKDPGRRFQHMDDVRIALEELKEDSDSGAMITSPGRPARGRRPLYILLAFAAVLAVVAGGWYYFHPAAQPGSALTAAPLTSYPGFESEPALSPDGGDVAFTWNGGADGQNYDIYRKLIGPGQPLRLTTDPGRDFSPAWSPDGRWIAFLRFHKERNAGVYLIPALGGSERMVGEVRIVWDPFAPKRFLDWSPDGKWLAICDRSSVFLFSPETGERRRLTVPPERASDDDPAFSPDGKALAFSRRFSYIVNQLYVVELGPDLAPRGEPRRLTQKENWYAAHPAWSRDLQELIFAWGYPGNLNLWRTSIRRAGPPRLVTSSEESAVFPALSRRGNRLVFARQTLDLDVWRMELPGPDGKPGPPKRLISSTRPDILPQYSPDGTHVALSSERSGSPEIWVCDSSGSNCRQITSYGGPEGGTPRWSPDGTQIASDSRVLGQAEIVVTSVHGGTSRNLTNHPAQEVVPSWSRDGRSVYFTSNRSGREEIWKCPAQGGEALQVTRQGGSGAMESLDGKHVYYARAGGLWRVPAGGGEETRVLDSITGWWGFAIAADGIYFNPRPEADGKNSLWFHRFSTAKAVRVAGIDKSSFGLSVSPDGRWILYSQLDRQDSDLMLVENFR